MSGCFFLQISTVSFKFKPVKPMFSDVTNMYIYVHSTSKPVFTASRNNNTSHPLITSPEPEKHYLTVKRFS